MKKFVTDYRTGKQPITPITRNWRCSCIPCFISLVLLLVQQNEVDAGFSYTSSMISARKNHTATTLVDGRVLITGGTGTSGITNSAEIFDPVTATFASTGPMVTKRTNHTATLLLDGRVLITGGSDGAVSKYSLISAEIYNPTTGSFTSTGSMTVGRIFHTATRLSDGKVLIIGGNNSTVFNATPVPTTELFDPTAGTIGIFTASDSMATPRANHTTTLLNDGTVLVAGGQSGSTASTTLASAQIYNSTTGLFLAEIGPLANGRRAHSATLLIDGRVLFAGGYRADSSILSTAEVFSPNGSGTGTFSPTSSMISNRINHTAVRLLNGKVLITGGFDGIDNLASTELFDPLVDNFNLAGTMFYSKRASHSTALLKNGTVLISGGTGPSGTLLSAELYDPVSIKVSPTVYSFPDKYISDPPAPAPFTISNSGPADLALNSIVISGTGASMFSLDTVSCGPLPFTLLANGANNCLVNVDFIPTSGGVKSATLDVYSSDPEMQKISVALSARALALTFTINLNGSGAGTTASIQDGLNCQSSSSLLCQAQVGPGTEISVFARGDKDSLFTGWSGVCSGNSDCTTTVFSDSSATATFDYIKPARINSSYYPSLKEAYTGAADGNTIQARDFTFTGPLDFNKNIGVTLKGGYDLNYSPNNANYSVVTGKFTISKGSVIVEKIIIRGGL